MMKSQMIWDAHFLICNFALSLDAVTSRLKANRNVEFIEQIATSVQFSCLYVIYKFQ